MFLADPTATSEPAKLTLNRWANENSLNQVVHGAFVLRFSDKWKMSRKGDDLNLFKGVAHTWTTPGSTLADATDSHQTGALAEAIGYFTSVLVCQTSLTLTRSLYRSTDIFYTLVDQTPIFCSDLSALVAARGGFGQQSLDLEYCHDFVACQQKFGGQTPFLQIRELMLGESIAVGQQAKLHAEFVNRPLELSCDITDILKTTLEKFVDSFDNTILMFSGGLDSSTLLWVLRENGTPALAVHTESMPDARESEYREALAIAQDLGCEIVRLMPTPVEDLSQAFRMHPINGISSPYDIPLFNNSDSTPCQIHLEGSRLILTGHGGDHVFVQNPGHNVCFSALRHGHLLAFLRIAKKLARLKGRSAYEIIRHNLYLLMGLHTPLAAAPKWLSPVRVNSANEHYLLRGLDRRTAKYSHLSTILLALHSCRALPGETTALSPFLLQNVIGHVLATPVENMFSETHDRITIRRPVHNQTGMNFVWRRTKRPSSTWFFEIFSKSKNNLLNALHDGKVTAQLNINRHLLDIDIEQNCELSLTGSLKNIINLFKLEAYIHSIESQSTKLLTYE